MEVSLDFYPARGSIFPQLVDVPSGYAYARFPRRIFAIKWMLNSRRRGGAAGGGIVEPAKPANDNK